MLRSWRHPHCARRIWTSSHESGLVVSLKLLSQARLQTCFALPGRIPQAVAGTLTVCANLTLLHELCGVSTPSVCFAVKLPAHLCSVLLQLAFMLQVQHQVLLHFPLSAS